jgi:hypothetical protein
MTEFSLQEFAALEVQNNLYSMECYNINPWELVRFDVVQKIRSKLTEQSGAHDRPDGINAYLKAAKLILQNTVRKNPFLSDTHPYLFFGHPRRKQEADEYWWDLYCDPIYEETDIDYLHLEYSDFLSHKTPAKTESLRYIDMIDLIGVFAGKLNYPTTELPEDIVDQILSMESDIYERYDMKVDIHHRIQEKLSERAATRRLYKRVICQVDPDVVFLVVSYGRGMKTVIEVSKSLNIPVVELQHGVIYSGHPGYDFPDSATVDLFPNYLYTFGEFWNSQANYPIGQESIIAFGYPYLDRQSELVNADANPKQILFISQGTIGGKFSKVAVELNKELDSEWKIIYKLHPGEYNRWKDEYRELRESDVTVIEGDQPSLYQLFAESRVQVGVGSTALFEGSTFDLETFVYDLPGSNTLNPLVKHQNKKKVSSAVELAEMITAKESENTTDYPEFFRSTTGNKLTDAIEQVTR